MAKKAATRKSVQKGFQDYLLNEGKTPETVRILTNYLNITEASFFELFGSLGKVESSIWEDYYDKTLKVLNKDPDFESMSGREKHLSFLFTLLEIIKEDRSYVQYRLLHKVSSPFPEFLLRTRRALMDSEIGWVTPPRFIPEKGHKMAHSGYKAILWKHSIALINFWIRDDSEGASDTDAFIEKSTRTLFDVGELPALDSVIDLGKFFLQKIGFTKATADA